MLSSQLGGGGWTQGAVYCPLSHPQQPQADEVPGLCIAKAKRTAKRQAQAARCDHSHGLTSSPDAGRR